MSSFSTVIIENIPIKKNFKKLDEKLNYVIEVLLNSGDLQLGDITKGNLVAYLNDELEEVPTTNAG